MKEKMEKATQYVQKAFDSDQVANLSEVVNNAANFYSDTFAEYMEIFDSLMEQFADTFDFTMKFE